MERALKQNIKIPVKDAHSISNPTEYRFQQFFVEGDLFFISGNFLIPEKSFQKGTLQG